MSRFLVNRHRAENDFDGFFSNFINNTPFLPALFSETPSDKAFNPKVNIAEHDDSISLTFELPGMEKSDIKVAVQNNMLSVSGSRNIESEVKTDGYVRTEIASGSFSRSFNLPDTVIQDDVKADYKNGLLQVVLTKKEEMKPKEIEVKVS